MSQHSQRTQQGPSGGQVVAGAVAIALSAAASVYVVSGPGLDPRKAVAVVLGGVLTGLLTVHVMGLVAERAVVADRAERAAERERMIEDYEREIVARERELDTRERELALGRQETRPGPEPYVVPEPVAPPRWEAPEPPRVDQGWMDAGRPPPNDGISPVDANVTRYLNEELDPGLSRNTLSSYVTGAAGWRAPEPRRFDYQEHELDEEPRRTPEPWNAFEPVPPSRAALGSVAVPLPPREPDGYVDPGPYSSFVPVSPGRTTGGYEIDCDGSCGDLGCPAYVDRAGAATEVMARVDADPDATEVIQRVR